MAQAYGGRLGCTIFRCRPCCARASGEEAEAVAALLLGRRDAAGVALEPLARVVEDLDLPQPPTRRGRDEERAPERRAEQAPGDRRAVVEPRPDRGRAARGAADDERAPQVTADLAVHHACAQVLPALRER